MGHEIAVSGSRFPSRGHIPTHLRSLRHHPDRLVSNNLKPAPWQAPGGRGLNPDAGYIEGSHERPRPTHCERAHCGSCRSRRRELRAVRGEMEGHPCRRKIHQGEQAKHAAVLAAIWLIRSFPVQVRNTSPKRRMPSRIVASSELEKLSRIVLAPVSSG